MCRFVGVYVGGGADDLVCMKSLILYDTCNLYQL